MKHISEFTKSTTALDIELPLRVAVINLSDKLPGYYITISASKKDGTDSMKVSGPEKKQPA